MRWTAANIVGTKATNTTKPAKVSPKLELRVMPAISTTAVLIAISTWVPVIAACDQTVSTATLFAAASDVARNRSLRRPCALNTCTSEMPLMVCSNSPLITRCDVSICRVASCSFWPVKRSPTNTSGERISATIVICHDSVSR